ncbi:hypothetical protein J4H86_20595 [Spiractinospora alimapuensis]|uniref:IclR family transcriptional regulator domain-containing protein n=1 Tax=Spiractinospora alimapuensis TaxID=2820884 RepID=UPI001F492D8A|nr:IclR family transcriptional regulator C-terminal domain-containing protein [Spiractinospora alimapuensis]QVQ51200.1 hypothetical protein J4H86_20595 [Spiractinospora alimapuensis]
MTQETELLVGQTASLGQYALPVMRELRDDLNETVTLAIRVGDSIVYTDPVQSTNVICYSAPLRVRRPLWPTSAGKVFPSQEQDPESTLRALESEPLEEGTVAARLRELEEVARTGMGFNRGETVGDVSAVAVGVRRADELVGSISVAGPRERLAHRLEEIGHAV